MRMVYGFLKAFETGGMLERFKSIFCIFVANSAKSPATLFKNRL